MSNIVWLPSMSVGIDKWDSDHKALLELINRLDQTLQARMFDAAVVRQAIDTLVDYAEIHFASEERAMEQLGYPRWEAHRVEHAKMREWVAKQRRRAEADDCATVLSDMAEHLVHWLYNHVLTVDMQYSEFFCDQRRKLDALLREYEGLRLQA